MPAEALDAALDFPPGMNAGLLVGFEPLAACCSGA
jgi:hypothetical protein